MTKATLKNKPKKTQSTAKAKDAANRTLNDRPLDIKPKFKTVALPKVWQLSRTSLALLWRYRRVFLGIIIIYGIVNFVVAQGFSGGINVSTLDKEVSGLFTGQFKQISSGLTVFAVLLTSVGSSGSSSTGGFGYQLILLIIASLAVIWTIRNCTKAPLRVRDAYYRGMYPFIPFLCILIVIGLELLPMIGGISLLIVALNNSIAITAIEQLLFGLIALLLTSLTVFLLSSSIFAMYIVTLPDMTPIKALRSAKDLVRGRRWPIIARLLYLPLALLITLAIIMLPVIIFIPTIAEWVFMLVTLLIVPVVHCYLYNLYRELLE